MDLLSVETWKENQILIKLKEEKNELSLSYVASFSYNGDDIVINCNRESPLYFKCL